MGNVKELNIKNQTYYFFNDMIKKLYKKFYKKFSIKLIKN